MIAYDDIKPQVSTVLSGSEGEYDIDAITTDLCAAYDLCGQFPTETLESIDSAGFWAIVEKHTTDA